MRFLYCICVLVSCIRVGPVHAQLVVTGVEAGFRACEGADRAGVETHYKAGAWTPVFVQVEGGPAGSSGGKLVIETTDSADVLNRYTIAVPNLRNNKRAVVTGYARPGSLGADIRVTGVDADGHRTTFTGEKNYEALDFTKQVFLVVGARPADLDKAAASLDADARKGRVRVATCVSEVDKLPDRWFGYEGIDLLIVTTGNRTFLRRLLDDRTGRKEALGTSAHRGGRMFVSVAPENAGLVASLLETWRPSLPPVLPGTSRKLATADRLGPLVTFARAYGKAFDGQAPLEAADLRAVGPVDVLEVENAEQPLMLRVPYGLGSVTFLGIDLGTGPFTRWAGRELF